MILGAKNPVSFLHSRVASGNCHISEVQRGDWAEIDQDSKIYTDFNEVSNRLRKIMNQQAGTVCLE